MEMLKEICSEVEKVLDHVENDCQVIIHSLNDFGNYVSSYAAWRLGRKLQILGSWIIVLVEGLYKEHKGKGYVCVFLTQKEGITVHWVETKKIVADKSWFEAYGSKVLSPEEAIGIICEMVDEIVSNNWVKVMEWLNKYGKSPGLDFSKFP